MHSAKPAKPNRKAPSQKAIRRAVASSTAIETGQAVTVIERRLESKSSRFRDIELASP